MIKDGEEDNNYNRIQTDRQGWGQYIGDGAVLTGTMVVEMGTKYFTVSSSDRERERERETARDDIYDAISITLQRAPASKIRMHNEGRTANGIQYSELQCTM